MGFRSIGGAVVIATAFKRNTGAGQSRLVSPFLNYSHFLNSPCVNQYRRFRTYQFTLSNAFLGYPHWK